MTKGDGLPCKRCGTSEWRDNGNCRQCDRENGRRWRLNNPDKDRERHRRWDADNPEKRREYTRQWAARNPEKEYERSRRWAAENPDKANAKNHRYRTRKTEAGGDYTAAEFRQLCDLYDNRCLCCRKKKKLTADHVIPVVAGGTSDISNIQPLCKSCNSSKRGKTTDYRTKPGILRWIQRELFDKL